MLVCFYALDGRWQEKSLSRKHYMADFIFFFF